MARMGPAESNFNPVNQGVCVGSIAPRRLDFWGVAGAWENAQRWMEQVESLKNLAKRVKCSR